MRAGGMIGPGVLGIDPTRAWAQAIPMSLEEGGTAGALTSNMTFRNEIAQVFDDGVDVAIAQSDMLEYFRTQRSANLEGRRHCIRYLQISEMPVLATAKAPSDLWQGVSGREYPAGSIEP
jgi:hypothetical protein